jgi:hypothetical protein
MIPSSGKVSSGKEQSTERDELEVSRALGHVIRDIDEEGYTKGWRRKDIPHPDPNT